MNVYVWNRLPSTYQEVEYIQSSWTQRVEIWSIFKTSYKITIDFQMTATWGDQIPVWVREIISGTQYRYGINAYSSNFKVISWWSSWSNTISEDTNRHTITIYKTTATVDGTNYSCSYVDHTFNMWIYVFDYNIFSWSSNFPSKNRLYKLDVYDENWNHIHDVVPCYRKSDNVIWLYDLVNNQFYTNSWTGTFSKWSDVVLCELQNAYIGNWLS
jgi:hypothetical protein